jgi:hypothetical protein
MLGFSHLIRQPDVERELGDGSSVRLIAAFLL